jgi:hypothetical protein
MSLLSLDGDDLRQSHLASMIFDDSLRLKRMLSAIEKAATSATADSQGVKFPKIDVPVFNGKILTGRLSGNNSQLRFILIPICRTPKG